MKEISICAIAKNEHCYINEWVKYHLNLGFDHIYIFDNDDNTSAFIGNYIDIEYINKVTFFNVRGQKQQWFQQNCYNWFYQNYNQNFDWCAFIDIDEFIVLNTWHDIKKMLADDRFKSFSSIKVCWRVYGDDECVSRDMRTPVFSFFKKQLFNSPLKAHAKQITRGGLHDAEIHNHCCFINGLITGQCTVDGTTCFEENGGVNTNGAFLFNDCYINHYMTKTLDEFLHQKFCRGDAMFAQRNISADYFWRVNKPTLQKKEYIDKYIEHPTSNITIVVASCDKNEDTFLPFHHCLEKYWPNHPRVIYSTETTNNPFYETLCLNYDFNHWGKRISETIQKAKTDFILLMVDDIFIHKNVNNNIVESLISIFSHKTAAINLERRFDPQDVQKNGLVSIRSKHGRYKTSMMCQLWAKDKLTRVLSGDGTPWDIEYRNNAGDFEYLVLNYGDILDWGKYSGSEWCDWGLFRGKWAPSCKTFLDKEGITIDYSKRGFYK